MMALRGADPVLRRELLRRFRSQADRSFTGPKDDRSHRDGWGIVGRHAGPVFHFGRSTQDASRDPDYERAVDRTQVHDAGSFLIAHVRNASVGTPSVLNTHPFIRDRWAFCHNGTIHNLEAPPGLRPEGETDSERVFLHLLEAARRLGSMGRAVRDVIPRIAKKKHSSLTFLLTDGAELYAFRRVGTDLSECGTRECAVEHYTLGYGSVGDALVVCQERQLLPELQGWTEIPDGSLVVWPRIGPPRVTDVFDAPTSVEVVRESPNGGRPKRRKAKPRKRAA